MKLFTFAAVIVVVMAIWMAVRPAAPARVQIEFDLGEHYTSIYDDPADPDSYREWYVVYKLVNREDERAVTKLRFVCGRHSTRFEERDIGPHARVAGKLRVMSPGLGFDPDSCEPQYDLVSARVF